MVTVTFYSDTYTCTKAIKGSNYIHLLDENDAPIAAFDGISDFSNFSISGGSWTTPTDDGNCYVAVVRDDGAIAKGNHRCNEISNTKTYTVTLSSSASAWTAITGGYSMSRSISGLTTSDLVVPAVGNNDLWIDNELNIQSSTGAITITVTSLPASSTTIYLTVIKAGSGGAL